MLKANSRLSEMVEYLNKFGLASRVAHDGSNKTNVSMFYISFDKSVTDSDIIEFMKKHLNNNGAFTSCGRFAERIYVYSDTKVEYQWCYFAATPEAVDADLNKWISEDSK